MSARYFHSTCLNFLVQRAMLIQIDYCCCCCCYSGPAPIDAADTLRVFFIENEKFRRSSKLTRGKQYDKTSAA